MKLTNILLIAIAVVSAAAVALRIRVWTWFTFEVIHNTLYVEPEPLPPEVPANIAMLPDFGVFMLGMIGLIGTAGVALIARGTRPVKVTGKVMLILSSVVIFIGASFFRSGLSWLIKAFATLGTTGLGTDALKMNLLETAPRIQAAGWLFAIGFVMATVTMLLLTGPTLAQPSKIRTATRVLGYIQLALWTIVLIAFGIAATGITALSEIVDRGMDGGASGPAVLAGLISRTLISGGIASIVALLACKFGIVASALWPMRRE